MNRYLAVMLGGAFGSLGRFLLSTAITKMYPGPFAVGTFVVNVTGSLLIGLLTALFLSRPELPANLRLLLVTGVLGGYTTFSSFELEAIMAMRTGATGAGVAYLLISVGLGLLATWCGLALGLRLWQQS